MAGNASIVVDIKAQISGYEEQLNKVKQSMKQVDPSTIIGKGLNKTLEQAETKLTSLLKRAESRITSQGQLDHLFDELHLMDEMMRNLGQGLQNVGMNDVFTSASERAKELGQQIREAQDSMKTQGKTFIDDLRNGAKSNEFNQIMQNLKLDPDKMGIDEFISRFDEATKSAQSNVNSPLNRSF